MTLVDSAQTIQYVEALLLKMNLNSKVLSVQQCEGGFINYVWRVHLSQTTQFIPSHPSVSTIIIKSSASHLKYQPNVYFSTTRSDFEAQALSYCAELRHTDDRQNKWKFITPVLLFSDEVNHIIIMEDVGECNTNLEEWVKSTSLLKDTNHQLNLTSSLGSEFGPFLAHIHFKSKNDLNRMKLNLDCIEFLKGFAFDPVESLAIEAGVNDHRLAPAVQEQYDTLFGAHVNNGHSHFGFIVGDLWPNSFLMSLHSSNLNSCAIIDWEFSGPGNILTDIGIFLFWIWMLSTHESDTVLSKLYQCLAKSFFASYSSHHTLSDGDLLVIKKHFGIMLFGESQPWIHRWCKESCNAKSTLCSCQVSMRLHATNLLVEENLEKNKPPINFFL
ncbi:beta-1,4-mannosyltransferase [Acrasis kona]|uniref:Beta-1,4-mannosyltransferase n=1 Tax=Acrasis kona TaxID=1008807 RepID=A0AAW2YUZ4_9EUKA